MVTRQLREVADEILGMIFEIEDLQVIYMKENNKQQLEDCDKKKDALIELSKRIGVWGYVKNEYKWGYLWICKNKHGYEGEE